MYETMVGLTCWIVSCVLGWLFIRYLDNIKRAIKDLSPYELEDEVDPPTDAEE